MLGARKELIITNTLILQTEGTSQNQQSWCRETDLLACHASPSLLPFFLHFIFSELSITTRSRLQLLKCWLQNEARWKVSHCSHYRSWAHSLFFQLLEPWQPDRCHTNRGPVGTKGHIATTQAAGEGKIKEFNFYQISKVFILCLSSEFPKTTSVERKQFLF